MAVAIAPFLRAGRPQLGRHDAAWSLNRSSAQTALACFDQALSLMDGIDAPERLLLDWDEALRT